MLLWTLGYRYLFKVVLFIFSDISPEWSFWVVGSTISSLLRNFTIFNSGIAISFPPAVYKVSFCPCPGQLSFFYDSHSDSCGVISQYGFDLHFSDDHRFQASFHVPFGHLYDFFGKTSVQIFCPVVGFFFFMLSCIKYLHILYINPLSVIYFANIFSHSLACLFILLMTPFAV